MIEEEEMNKAKWLLIGILVGAVPAIILSAWLDSSLTGARSFKGYFLICFWEYVLVCSGLAGGYWIAKAWKGEK